MLDGTIDGQALQFLVRHVLEGLNDCSHIDFGVS
jgi:hypothetical protein